MNVLNIDPDLNRRPCPREAAAYDELVPLLAEALVLEEDRT